MATVVSGAGAPNLDDFRASLSPLSVGDLLDKYPTLATSANRLDRSEGQAIHHALASRPVEQLLAAGEALQKLPASQDNKNRAAVIEAILAAKDIHPSWLAVGTTVRDAAVATQEKISAAVDRFEDAARDDDDLTGDGNPLLAQVLGGAFKSVTTLATGAVAVAGSAARLVDGRARADAANAVGTVAAHPGVFAAALGHGFVASFEERPGDVVGQALGFLLPIGMSLKATRAVVEVGSEAEGLTGAALLRVQMTALRAAAEADLGNVGKLYKAFKEISQVSGRSSPATAAAAEALNKLVAVYNPGGRLFQVAGSALDNDAAFAGLKLGMRATAGSPSLMATYDIRALDRLFDKFLKERQDVDALNALVAKYNPGGPLFSVADMKGNFVARNALRAAIEAFGKAPFD